MISLISWNIQCGRGVDGIVDLDRIATTIAAQGSADILCLQEVSRFDPACNDAGADQVARLSALFPGYTPVFGPAYDRLGEDGRRRQLGNLILSRLPILQSFAHPLPQPPAPGIKHMPRQATEVVVATTAFPVRVITTHLEFHSAPQRQAQIERLRALHHEAAANAVHPGQDASGPYAQIPRPAALVLCGDFNMAADDPALEHLQAPFADSTPRLLDAWGLCHGSAPHAPTCGIFDHAQWPQGDHCRDFFLVSQILAPLVATLDVDTATAASDHQPVRLSLRE